MTAPGGTGVSSGDDYVAARLAIDIPTEGVQGVRELTESVDRFRTAMEQATRAEADMSTYLTSMGEAARRATEYQAGLVEQLSTLVSLQGHLSGAPMGGTAPHMVPAGYTAPFQGPTGLGQAPGQRVPNPTDVTNQLQEHAEQHPREYRNMAAARGAVDTSPGVNLTPTTVSNLSSQIADREHAARVQDHITTPPGPTPSPQPGHPQHKPPRDSGGGDDEPFARVRHDVAAATGFAGQVMGELGAHDGLPFLPLAQQGLDAARNLVHKHTSKAAAPKSEEDGSEEDGQKADNEDDKDPKDKGMGGLEKTLGGLSGALGVVGSLFGLVQSGGQMVQGWRNIAAQRGGDAGEGFEASFRARMQASNPYLTTEQSRQMLQAGLSEGYMDSSGAPMGEQGAAAMDFMNTGLQHWDMSVPQLVQQLRLAGKGTTLSIAELTQSLQGLKDVVKNGGPLSQSLDDIRDKMSNKEQQLQAQGVNPEQARQQGFNSAVAFNGDPLLQGTMSTMTPNATGTADMRLHGGPGGTPLDVPPGLTPDAIQQWMDDKYPDQSPMYNALEYRAKYYKNLYRDTNDQTKNPQGWFNARQAFYRYITMNFPNSDEASDKEKANKLYEKFAWDGATAKSVLSDNKKAHEDETAGARKTTESGGGLFGGQAKYSSALIDDVVKGYGGGDPGKVIQVEDGKGGWVPLDPKNKQQVQDLNDDKIRWRHNGDTGKGLTLDQTPESTNDKFSTDDPNNPKGISGKDDADNGKDGKGKGGAPVGKVQIELTGEAKRLLQVKGDNPVPLTPTQMGANAGDGKSQVNDPSFFDIFLDPLGLIRNKGK